MYYLYSIKNAVNGKVYAGITNNPRHRWHTHAYGVRSNKNKSALYSAMRKHGIENFTMDIVSEFYTREEACEAEVFAISFMHEENIPNYNLHPGGTGGYAVPEDRKEEWKLKLKVKRSGKKPALGMKHTDENKAIFSEGGKARWDKYGRYPKEVLDYGFAEANRRYGISKTHYYRLRKEAGVAP